MSSLILRCFTPVHPYKTAICQTTVLQFFPENSAPKELICTKFYKQKMVSLS